MKNQNTYPALRFIFFFILILKLTCIDAQVQTARYNTSMTTLSNGFYEYLPQGYSSSGSQTYPLIIFVHGLGELGTGSTTDLPKVLVNGPPRQINQGIFPTSFTVSSRTYSPIVISPQFTQWPNPIDINNIIDYCIQHYRIDQSRIYLTGLSMGGGVVWAYIANDINYANRIAAVVPISGAAQIWQGQIIGAADIAVWATHNDLDPVVPVSETNTNINLINTSPTPPSPLAKKTIFSSNSHDAWTRTYDFNFRENGINVYEWMFQYTNAGIVLPVTGLEFNAQKQNGNKALLHWKTFGEINNSGFEIQRSNNGADFSAIAFVASTSVSGAGAVYSYTDLAPFPKKNYYRIKQVDRDNSISYSPVRFVEFDKNNSVTIFPNPVADVLNLNTDYNFEKAQLSIRDMSGRLVLQSVIHGSGTISVPLNKLAAGFYTVEITEGITTIRLNFIRQ